MTPEKIRHYVTLKHTTPIDVHWDFMLEDGDHLSTWRINIPPTELKSTPAQAEKIFNHDLKFLTYQGPVKNNTGQVTTEDKGTYKIIEQTEENIQIEIEAETLNGTYNITWQSEYNWLISPK